MLSCSSFSQKTKKDEGIKIGIKGGINVSNFIGDFQNNAIRTGVHLGVLAEIIISEKFSVQPEILYSGQGFSNQNPQDYSRYKFDYINLPVIAKFYLTKSISLETGPQVGFLISSKNKSNLSNYEVDGQKTIDFGLNLGAGFDLNNHVFFQARYNLGLTNINDETTTTNNFKYTNSVIQFSVGYLF